MKPVADDNSQDVNWADYCDALRSEHWLKLLDAARRERPGRSLFQSGAGAATPASRIAGNEGGADAGAK